MKIYQNISKTNGEKSKKSKLWIKRYKPCDIWFSGGLKISETTANGRREALGWLLECIDSILVLSHSCYVRLVL